MGRCTIVQDEGQCGPPSVVFKELSKICERLCFTIAVLSYEFLQILHPVLYEILTVSVLTGTHKTYIRALSFDFFRVIPQRCQ
jgi:hypothetical protein